MKLIGITGGVGAGKSEIISYLESKYNCRIEYADKVAHMLEEPGQVCFDKLVNLLGTGILKDGKIDKASMANAMFKDDTLVDKVNATLPSTHQIRKMTVRTEDFKRTGSMKVSRI